MKAGRTAHLYQFDKTTTQGNEGRAAGVDESGRGPLAGPVVAAAVILFRKAPIEGLNDSKQLSADKRERLFWQIIRGALVGLGVVEEKIIDEINIYQASRLAMRQAVMSLSHSPSYLLIDGPMRIDLPIAQLPIIEGDRKSASIAAASIVAKVYRDALMNHYGRLYPGYFFYSHKGYPTLKHRQTLSRLGPCPIHRRSFAPVHLALDLWNQETLH